jgi:DNA-binding TFAR19-related protein (PDSD5 family)
MDDGGIEGLLREGLTPEARRRLEQIYEAYPELKPAIARQLITLLRVGRGRRSGR